MQRAEQLLETLRAIAPVLMTWWVSSTALCAAIIGALWANRRKVASVSHGALNALFGLVLVFFVSISVFGVLATWAATSLGLALGTACAAASSAVCTVGDAAVLTTGIAVGVAIGTTSFIIATIAWISAWVITSKGRRM